MLTANRLLATLLTYRRVRTTRVDWQWAIPKIDRSFYILLNRVTTQAVEWEAESNAFTLSFYYFSIAFYLGTWACVKDIQVEESRWWGIFIHRDQLSIYRGSKGHSTYELPWQVRCVEPYKEHVITSAPSFQYLDKANDRHVNCSVSVYYILVQPKCLSRFPFLSWKVHRANIVFDEEVGNGVGSWKGGTLESSFLLPSLMSPYEALQFYQDKHN